MPQMMPMNWLILMFFMIYTLYLFNNLCYFNVTYFKKMMSMQKLCLKWNWKW